MRPQSAKSKGRKLQQLVCRHIVEAFSDDLTEDDVRSTSMGAGGEDVLLSPRAQQLVPFSFEAKCCERVNVWSALEQAAANCPPDRTPCVVIKKNRTAPHAIIPLEVFVSMLSSARARPRPAMADKDRRVLHELQTLIARALDEAPSEGAADSAGTDEQDR